MNDSQDHHYQIVPWKRSHRYLQPRRPREEGPASFKWKRPLELLRDLHLPFPDNVQAQVTATVQVFQQAR